MAPSAAALAKIHNERPIFDMFVEDGALHVSPLRVHSLTLIVGGSVPPPLATGILVTMPALNCQCCSSCCRTCSDLGKAAFGAHLLLVFIAVAKPDI